MVTGQGCTDEDLTFCNIQADRSCMLDADGNALCSGCIADAVEFKSRCVPSDKIELFHFIEEYRVEYLTDLSREERWLLLKVRFLFVRICYNDRHAFNLK
jgi:hypothetical protein